MTERTADELHNDPTIQRVLANLARRRPICPRCCDAPQAANSRHGWCQPCETEHDERIKASKRRSYHRRKQLPTITYGQHRTAPDDGVIVGEEGWRLLKVAEAANLLGLARSTVYGLINSGELRSILIAGRHRRIPADAIADLVTQAEQEQTA